MSWLCSLTTKIVWSRHQPLTKQVLPDSINSDASRQRVAFTKQPLSQIKPVSSITAYIQSGQNRRRAGVYLVAMSSVDASDMHMSVAAVLRASGKSTCLCIR